MLFQVVEEGFLREFNRFAFSFPFRKNRKLSMNRWFHWNKSLLNEFRRKFQQDALTSIKKRKTTFSFMCFSFSFWCKKKIVWNFFLTIFRFFSLKKRILLIAHFSLRNYVENILYIIFFFLFFIKKTSPERKF